MSYQITDYSKNKAKELGVKIKPSSKPNKKIDVYLKDAVISIGDNNYMDYPNYIKTKGKDYANQRRKLYKKRHEKDRHKKGTAGFYADRILW